MKLTSLQMVEVETAINTRIALLEERKKETPSPIVSAFQAQRITYLQEALAELQKDLP